MFSPVFGQEEPILTQYRTNMFLINPAALAHNGVHEVRLNYRQQWQKLNFSPRTAVLTYTGFMDSKNGLGISIMHDSWGNSMRNGVKLGYSYRLPLGYPRERGQNFLSMGLSVKMLQYRMDLSNVHFVDPSDPAISSNADQFLAGDVAFGLFYHNENFYTGLSSPNLIQTNNYLPFNDQSGVLSRLQRYYFWVLGYKFDYGNVKIEPSIMMRKIASTPYQMEGTVRFYLNEESLILGLSYRTGWIGGLMLGINHKSMKFIYSADFMPLRNDPNRPFGPSHELILGIDLGEFNTDWKRAYYVPRR